MEISQENRWIRWTGWILFCVTFLAVISGAGGVGLTWDETLAHFRGSEILREWLSLAQIKIAAGEWSALWDPSFHRKYWPLVTPENQRFFSINYHPPLTRILPTITWFPFHGWFGDWVAYRMAPAFLFAASIMVLFRVMARQFDYSTGLFAGLSLLLMPRVFGHAHIAATDMAMMSFWLFSVIAFHKGLDDKRWSYGFAILLGLAFSVKFTGALIPLALILYIIITREKRAWRNVGLAILICPVILIALNPSWWIDPVSDFFTHYIQTALNRNTTTPIATYYLGEKYPIRAPWHHSLVMTAVTIPVVILLFSIGGGISAIRQWRHSWVLLILSQLVFYYLILMLPISPNYDGVRLFLPVFPFLACLAGLGFRDLRDWMIRQKDRLPHLRQWGKAKLSSLIFGMVMFWPAVQLIAIHPYYLEYYNGLAGGVEGAHQRGFETTYWFDTVTPPVRDKINRLPPNSRIKPFPELLEYFRFLQGHQLIRPDLKFVMDDPDYWVVIPRQSKFQPATWEMYRNKKPIYFTSIGRVPILMIYMEGEGDAQ